MKRTSGRIVTSLLVIVVLAALGGWLYMTAHSSGGTGWNGVDVNVVEKYAAAAGHPARTPYINTDQGDLLLFVFTFGGAVGGFLAGYFWRKLMSEKPRGEAKPTEEKSVCA